MGTRVASAAPKRRDRKKTSLKNRKRREDGFRTEITPRGEAEEKESEKGKRIRGQER